MTVVNVLLESSLSTIVPVAWLSAIVALVAPDRFTRNVSSASSVGSPAVVTTNVCVVDRAGSACVLTTSLGLGTGDFLPGLDLQLNSMLGESDLLIGQNNTVLATQQLSELSTELSRVRANRGAAEANAAPETAPTLPAEPTLDDLREVARGIFPPLLAEEGGVAHPARSLRGQEMTASAFDEVPGIGPTRRRALLEGASEAGTRRLVGVRAQGMTACPCAQKLVEGGYDALDELQQRLRRMGLERAMRRAGARPGDVLVRRHPQSGELAQQALHRIAGLRVPLGRGRQRASVASDQERAVLLLDPGEATQRIEEPARRIRTIAWHVPSAHGSNRSSNVPESPAPSRMLWSPPGRPVDVTEPPPRDQPLTGGTVAASGDRSMPLLRPPAIRTTSFMSRNAARVAWGFGALESSM